MSERLKQVLTVVGILALSAGAFVGLALSLLLAVSPNSPPSLGIKVAIWLGTALFLIAGVVFVIRPRQRGWVARAASTLALIVGLFFFHPWLFGLPGRIDEIRFERGLHAGMTRAEVAALANSTHGEQQEGVDASTFLQDSKMKGVVTAVEYVDWVTFCVPEGNWYLLQFDRDNRLRAWTITRAGRGC